MAGTNILFVDDEKNILGAVQRVFRKEDYGILLAENGECGLNLLRQNHVAVVVSDQKMPGMGGVEFLRKAREAAPDAVRIMLTGQADMKEVAGAINQGEIYRYVMKPWVDEELRLTVRAAVERFWLIAENRRLQEETMRQNAEFYELNQTLEAIVEEKTKKLRDGFFSFVALCADMIELHDRLSGGHCKRVAALAKGLAQSLGIKGIELEVIWAAALLHEIGLIGVPREVLDRQECELSESELALVRNNPVLSQEMVSRIDVLKQVGIVLKSHMENFDGTGYPERLKGKEINAGSRILAVCRDYDLLRHARRQSKIDALAAIERGRSKRFDPDIVDAFFKFAAEMKDMEECEGAVIGSKQSSIASINIQQITAGMKLAKPLATGRGRLLVAEGTLLTEALIEKVLNFNRIDPITDTVFVFSAARI